MYIIIKGCVNIFEAEAHMLRRKVFGIYHKAQQQHEGHSEGAYYVKKFET